MEKHKHAGFFLFQTPYLALIGSVEGFLYRNCVSQERASCLSHVALRKDGTNVNHGYGSSIKCHQSFATMWQPGSDYLLLDRCSRIQIHNVRVQPTHLQIFLRGQDPFEVLSFVHKRCKSRIHVQPDIVIQIFCPFYQYWLLSLVFVQFINLLVNVPLDTFPSEINNDRMPALASVKNRIDFQCSGTRGRVHLFCAQRYNQSVVSF